MKAIFLTLLGAWGAVMISGCHRPGPRFEPRPSAVVTELQQVTPTNRIDPQWLRAPTNLFTLGPGDKLDIELIGDPGSKTTTIVGPDGKIYFNLVSGVDVWGLTLAQAKGALEKELSNFIRDRPQVGLTLRAVESQRVWVLGRLQAPGVYPMAGPMTLLEAIGLAGWTASPPIHDINAPPSSEELADLRRSFIIRKGKLLPVDFDRLLRQGDLSQNIYLQPDDFIYMPSAAAREVYVLGAVANPQTVPYREDLTLVGAVATALGTIKDADWWEVALVRGSLSQPKVAVLNYRAIVHGQAPDVKLEPQDIVYVPYTPYRYLTKYLDIALQTFVTSVAINAGARAVAGRPVQPAGIFIPLGSRITVLPPTPVAK